MPKRGDFENEFDADADHLLSDMEFCEDDTEQDIKLKEEVIQLYNARLDERIRRKKFVIERGLLDIKKTQKFEKKRTPEEREIINSMKIFARFNKPEDHERLVNSLIKERMLREVIEQLKYFRSKGMTTLDQIEKYIAMQSKQGRGDKKSYTATDDFFKSPEEFVSPSAAQYLQHTSLAKRGTGASGQMKKSAGSNQGIMAMPDYENLNNLEKILCEEQSIPPSEYLKFKKCVQIQAIKNRAVDMKYLQTCAADVGASGLHQKMQPIYDFFVKTNFISSKGK